MRQEPIAGHAAPNANNKSYQALPRGDAPDITVRFPAEPGILHGRKVSSPITPFNRSQDTNGTSAQHAALVQFDLGLWAAA